MNLTSISSISIGVPLLASFFRIHNADRNFYPFIWLIWMGSLNEFTSFLLFRNGVSNYLSSNIYVLLDSGLILLQFYCWRAFSSKKYFFLLVGLTFILWVADFGFISKTQEYCSYFGMCYSFLAVIIAILMVNKIIVTEKRSLFKNAIFLLCSAVIIFYTYNALVEIFWIYGLDKSDAFRGRIYNILDYINIFTNIIYAIAILWIPKKQEFIPQF